jgi:hypothetical protein
LIPPWVLVHFSQTLVMVRKRGSPYDPLAVSTAPTLIGAPDAALPDAAAEAAVLEDAVLVAPVLDPDEDDDEEHAAKSARPSAVVVHTAAFRNRFRCRLRGESLGTRTPVIASPLSSRRCQGGQALGRVIIRMAPSETEADRTELRTKITLERCMY